MSDVQLGVHLPLEKVAGSSRLSAEDKDVRTKLYWSAFVWDKTISLAFGREPTFPPRPGHDPSKIPAFDDDSLSWTPFYANSDNCPASLVEYEWKPQNVVITFRANARLSGVRQCVRAVEG